MPIIDFTWANSTETSGINHIILLHVSGIRVTTIRLHCRSNAYVRSKSPSFLRPVEKQAIFLRPGFGNTYIYHQSAIALVTQSEYFHLNVNALEYQMFLFIFWPYDSLQFQYLSLRRIHESCSDFVDFSLFFSSNTSLLTSMWIIIK